jgi:hypothetical protein
VNITEKVEITPKEGEKIPITVSGDAGVRLQGDLNRLDIGSRENRPIYINVNVTNVNAPKTDISLSFSETITISSILSTLNQSSLPAEDKNRVQQLVKEFEQVSSKANPEESKLRSTLSKIFPIARDVGLMLLKYCLDNHLSIPVENRWWSCTVQYVCISGPLSHVRNRSCMVRLSPLQKQSVLESLSLALLLYIVLCFVATLSRSFTYVIIFLLHVLT